MATATGAEGACLTSTPHHHHPDHASELALLVKQRTSDVVTLPLACAVGLSLVTQFLAGYNTAVLNSVSLVVFPGHSTTAWAVAVGAFAIGGPVRKFVCVCVYARERKHTNNNAYTGIRPHTAHSARVQALWEYPQS